MYENKKMSSNSDQNFKLKSPLLNILDEMQTDSAVLLRINLFGFLRKTFTVSPLQSISKLTGL